MSTSTAAGPRRVLLVGFMAAGKTTVGERLARRLGWSFVDVDAEVERVTGRPIPELFRERGEAAFRALEASATRAALARDCVVVAAGGGWVSSPGAWSGVPAETLSVWLRISPEASLRRAGGASAGAGRPLLAGEDPLGRARRLLAEREGAYARALYRVETEGREPGAVVEEILALVRASGAKGIAADANPAVPPATRK